MGFDRRTLLKPMVSLAATLGFGGVSQAAVVSWSQSAQQAVKHKDSEDIMKTNTQQPIVAPWLALQVRFQLAHEQFTVPELVNLGIAAERAAFDLLAFSDHFQPWQADQGHSGQARITMSAIGGPLLLLV
jgi:hypothetical protein